MSSCDEHSTDILLFLDNDLHGEALDRFLAHLKVCAACSKQLEEERALSGLFQRTRPLYVAPEELRARVAAVVERTASADTVDSRRNRNLRTILPQH